MTPDPYTIKAGIVVVILAVILYDVYLANDNKAGNTYSEVIRGWFLQWSWLYYGVAFSLGVFMSHWGMP